MTKFLTTRNIESAIEDVIKGAKEELVLITPFLQINAMILERLGDASRRGVAIRLVCRGEDLRPEQKVQLVSIRGVELWFMTHLHAKCYANEQSLVLTSMNLYDASRKNREMGVLIKSGDAAFVDAMSEIDSIISNSVRHVEPRASVVKVVVPSRSVKKVVKSEVAKQGSCIRCSKSIGYNVERPLCGGCFVAWSKFKNEDYEEVYCHSCSKRAKNISMKRPQCYVCWKV